MEKKNFHILFHCRRMQITDKFWKNEMELVRYGGDPLSVECVE